MRKLHCLGFSLQRSCRFEARENCPETWAHLICNTKILYTRVSHAMHARKFLLNFHIESFVLKIL